MPKELTKEDLQKFNHTLTVGKLKKFLEEHNLPDDAIVVTQRVEDFYFEKGNWGVYKKEGHHSFQARKYNKKIDSGEFLNKEDYPNINPENLKKYTEEEIDSMKEQYHPAWCCVRYEDDKDILFIDLHY